MRKKKAGSRDTLRAYLIEHVGEVLDSEMLRSVANVSEWARRIRELRNEEGMNIVTHNDRSDLKPGQYMLEDLKPLPAFARTISKEARASVLDRNGFTCQMCGAVAGTGPRNVMWINSGALLGQDIQKTTAVAAPVVAPPVPLPAPAQTWTPPIAAAPMVPAQTWSPPPPVPSREKTVHVDGYYKRDGTYVRPHNRRPPSR
jgi:hypothetical protein